MGLFSFVKKIGSGIKNVAKGAVKVVKVVGKPALRIAAPVANAMTGGLAGKAIGVVKGAASLVKGGRSVASPTPLKKIAKAAPRGNVTALQLQQGQMGSAAQSSFIPGIPTLALSVPVLAAIAVGGFLLLGRRRA